METTARALQGPFGPVLDPSPLQGLASLTEAQLT